MENVSKKHVISTIFFFLFNDFIKLSNSFWPTLMLTSIFYCFLLNALSLFYCFWRSRNRGIGKKKEKERIQARNFKINLEMDLQQAQMVLLGFLFHWEKRQFWCFKIFFFSKKSFCLFKDTADFDSKESFYAFLSYHDKTIKNFWP